MAPAVKKDCRSAKMEHTRRNSCLLTPLRGGSRPHRLSGKCISSTPRGYGLVIGVGSSNLCCRSRSVSVCQSVYTRTKTRMIHDVNSLSRSVCLGLSVSVGLSRYVCIGLSVCLSRSGRTHGRMVDRLALVWPLKHSQLLRRP